MLQANHAPPGLPCHVEPIFAAEEDDDDDVVRDNNPFAGLREQQLQQQQRRDVVAAPRLDNRRWDTGFKLDLPEFHGSLQPEELLDWISSVEEILAFKQVPDDMCVPLVATHFKGHASAWWQQVKEQRVRAGKSRITSWEKLKRKLREAFLPYNYSRTLYTRLQNLRQGNKSFDDYATDFFALLRRNTLNETEEQVISRFIGGLRVQIQNSLLQINPASVSEAHQRALLLEQQSRGMSSSWNSTAAKSRFGVTVEPSLSRTTDQMKSLEAGDSAIPQRQGRTPTFKCFGCGGT